VYGVVDNFIVSAGEVVVQGVFARSWFLSSTCNNKFEGSGGYNVHTCHIVGK
jgi:hypothetical protein